MRKKFMIAISADKETYAALKEMSNGLGLSSSSITRILVKGAHDQYKRNRTLPTWGYAQIPLVTSEG